MKVYELMAALADCDAGAEVRVCRVFNSDDFGNIRTDKDMPTYDGSVESVDDGDIVYINGGAGI